MSIGSTNVGVAEEYTGGSEICPVPTTLLTNAKPSDPFISAVYVPSLSMYMFVAVPISYTVVVSAPVSNAWILDVGFVRPERLSLLYPSKLMKSGISFEYTYNEPYSLPYVSSPAIPIAIRSFVFYASAVA